MDASPPADTTPGEGGGGGGGGVTVQRVPLTLRFQMPEEDVGVYRALAWADGFVPGVQVTIHRDGSTDSLLTAVSDSTGLVRFERILTGTYTISGFRALDSGEAARLAVADQDIDALAGGDRVGVSAPSTTAVIALPAGRRGSLVISEYWFPPALTASSIYPFGGFVEVYNNSDTTIYLDGKLLGEGRVALTFGSSTWPCTVNATFRNDSLGLWVAIFYRFPGSGYDYPLSPGQAVIVATDAVDHRVVNAAAEDLSGADFEFIGLGDVDNPSVPNMSDVSLWEPALGHGLFFSSAHAHPFVGDNVDLAALTRSVMCYLNCGTVLRIPRAAVLDIAVFLSSTTSFERCYPQVHSSLDRQPGFLPAGDSPVQSIQRKVFRVLPDGRRVLLRTRTTSRDFEFRFPRTPKSVP